jgi:hypothetical protein
MAKGRRRGVCTRGARGTARITIGAVPGISCLLRWEWHEKALHVVVGRVTA